MSWKVHKITSLLFPITLILLFFYILPTVQVMPVFRNSLPLFTVCFQRQKSSSSQCYYMKMTSTTSWDTPDYRVDIKLYPNNTLHSLTKVLKPVKIPMWQIIYVQTHSNKMKVIYNGTMKVCEFSKYARRVMFFKPITTLFFDPKKVNYPLTCPLPAGSYYMKDITVPSDTPVLAFSYVPNTIYTLYGTVLSKLDNGTVIKLNHYVVNATIVKRC